MNRQSMCACVCAPSLVSRSEGAHTTDREEAATTATADVKGEARVDCAPRDITGGGGTLSACGALHGDYTRPPRRCRRCRCSSDASDGHADGVRIWSRERPLRQSDNIFLLLPPVA